MIDLCSSDLAGNVPHAGNESRKHGQTQGGV
jgi:hypothetical protein